jgi:hypothetical protein
MTNTNPPGIERPRYFHGQFLTAQDFADEQDYFLEKLRRHNRLLHGWGVVCGLRVAPTAKSCAVVVSPGYALDPCGDEVLVEEEILLRLSPPEGPEQGDGPEAAETDAASCPDGAWTVAIRYVEIPVRFVPGMGGSGDSDSLQASRIRESYELCALATLPALPAGSESGSNRGRSGVSGVCPPCPPDPEARWVVLAEVRVQGGRVSVDDPRPVTGSRAPG